MNSNMDLTDMKATNSTYMVDFFAATHAGMAVGMVGIPMMRKNCLKFWQSVTCRFRNVMQKAGYHGNSLLVDQ